MGKFPLKGFEVGKALKNRILILTSFEDTEEENNENYENENEDDNEDEDDDEKNSNDNNTDYLFEFINNNELDKQNVENNKKMKSINNNNNNIENEIDEDIGEIIFSFENNFGEKTDLNWEENNTEKTSEKNENTFFLQPKPKTLSNSRSIF